MALQYEDIVKQTGGQATNPQTGAVISVDQLAPAQKIELPQPKYDATEADTLAAGAENYAKLLTPTDTAYATDTAKSSALETRMEELLGVKAGMGAEQARLEQQAGIAQKNQQLAQIQGEIQVANAEYAKLDANYLNQLAKAEATARTAADYAGSSGALQRQFLTEKAVKASDIQLKVATAQALQGNIVAAQSSINRAIDLKYSTIDAELDLRERQLDAAYQRMTKAEQRRADAVRLSIEDHRQAVADRKEREKTLQSIALESARFGADPETMSRMQQASTLTEAIAIATPFLSAEFKRKVEQQKFDNQIQLRQVAISAGNLKVAQQRFALEQEQQAFEQQLKMLELGLKQDDKTISDVQKKAVQKGNVDLINNLATNRGLNSAVGPNYFGRFSVANKLTGVKSNFIAGVEQLRSQLNLETLIKAKGQGATFGALSDQELKMLSNAGTKIGAWAIKDKHGNVTGYNTNEKEFRKELDKINNFIKLDYVLNGGSPQDVGVEQQADGSYWTRNSDGSMTKLR